MKTEIKQCQNIILHKPYKEQKRLRNELISQIIDKYEKDK